jgi:hypothetical protein
MEAFSYFLDGKIFPGSIVLNHIANTYLFSVNLILPFCVLIYVDLGLYGDPERIWKHYKPQIIIGAVMLGATLINLITPVCYYISDKNVYERRPFGYVYYAVILYYLISAIIVTRRYEKENGARTFFNINMFLVPILIGAGLQFAFYGLSLAWLSSAIGLTGMYMMQQNETAYLDPLVDTYNRRYFDFLLTSWISRGYGFSGVMMDIDDFKSINDNCGHSEGVAGARTSKNSSIPSSKSASTPSGCRKPPMLSALLIMPKRKLPSYIHPSTVMVKAYVRRFVSSFKPCSI